jgi:ATP-dependent DNA helicase RecQ
VADVLAGAATARLESLGHDRLGAYGTLRDATRGEVRGWIDQLVGQGLLARTAGEYPTVMITKQGAQVLRGESAAGPLSRVTPAGRERGATSRVPSGAAATADGDGDRALFEVLRQVRRGLAEERGVPPYVIFSDATLRELARLRPATRGELLAVKRVGEWKCEEFGRQFLAAIAEHGAPPGPALST